MKQYNMTEIFAISAAPALMVLVGACVLYIEASSSLHNEILRLERKIGELDRRNPCPNGYWYDVKKWDEKSAITKYEIGTDGCAIAKGNSNAG